MDRSERPQDFPLNFALVFNDFHSTDFKVLLLSKVLRTTMQT